MTLITAPSGASSDAYCSVSDVSDYFANININKYNTWNSSDYDEAAQERAIRLATKIIDDHFDFLGKKTETTQALQWPRKLVPAEGSEDDSLNTDVDKVGLSSIIGYYSPYYDQFYGENSVADYLDEETVPDFVVEACSEIALTLLVAEGAEEDIFAVPDKITNANIKSESVAGAVSVTYFDPNRTLQIGEGIVKAAAWIKLTKYGSYKVNINTPGYSSQAIIG